MRRGYDELAGSPDCDVPIAGIGVEKVSLLDAQPRLERSRRIVESRVDDLTRSRANLLSDRIVAFKDIRLPPGFRALCSDCESNNAAADDERFDVGNGGKRAFI
jgi:hypothetical protein